MKKLTIVFIAIFLFISQAIFAQCQNCGPQCHPTGGIQCETYGNPAGCDGMFIDNSCVELTIILHTDYYGGETSWSLTDLITGGQIFNIPQGSLPGNETFVYEECIDPTHCYEFEILDSYGDGICCEYGKGGYKILLDGNVIADANANEDPFTGSSRQEHFGWGCSQPSSSGPPESLAEDKLIENIIHTLTAYPNPTTGLTTFEFLLEERSEATFEIYDEYGKRLEVLFEGIAEGGERYSLAWNPGNLPAGVYLYRLTTDNEVYHNQLILIK